MSAIASTSNDNPYAAFGLAGNADKARSNGLGQADFLRLMTEQMKNQDPLKPLEGQQFLAQLAQFSTVQGIEQMNSAMGSMASVMESDQTLRAAALVGREALVDANALQYPGEGTLRGEVVAEGAGPIQVDILDANGQRVARRTVQASGAGPVAWQWDGRDDAGRPMAAGAYAIKASSSVGDNASALPVRLAARVDSVSIEPTGLTLNLSGLGGFALGSVRRIS